MTRPIIVYANSFNENSGGVIVLHLLVHRLRAIGVDAYLMPYAASPYARRWGRVARRIGFGPLTTATFFVNATLARRSYRVSENLDTPIATPRHVEDAIVVYPESIDGNPLRARRVVRWLLHRPQYINPAAHFGNDELVFYYSPNFRGEQYEHLTEERHLHVRWVRSDIYFEAPTESPRSGVCYLIRKGRRFGGDEAVPEGAPVVDGLDHAAIADLFRSHEFVVSFDPHTMFQTYAMMCGCTPVLTRPPRLPQSEESKWPVGRPGVADGFDDVERARRTRRVVLDLVGTRSAEEQASVMRFVEIVRNHFG
jgi:hypothetical protein